jgi:hypothetical protein
MLLLELEWYWFSASAAEYADSTSFSKISNPRPFLLTCGIGILAFHAPSERQGLDKLNPPVDCQQHTAEIGTVSEPIHVLLGVLAFDNFIEFLD